jgi:tetratricopeptide (TPR) repeat protein
VAHVFISYSKKHRDSTERIAALLERQEIVAPDGSRERLTVWWDTSLLSGDTFHREITQQIDAARAVVVIWTEGSVASDWVYAEAQRGASQRKLVPLTERALDRHKVPLPYSALHTDYADDEAAIVASVMARLGGMPSEDVAALSDQDRWLLDPKAEVPLPRTARISPALLLQAKYSIVPFVDLDDRRSRLIDWALGRGAYQPQPTAGRVIHGPGGLGKTRLMIEAIRELADQGWVAGFLNRGTLGHATRGPQLEHLIRTGRDACGLLLVIDYAEGRADEVGELARLLIERERAGGAPARLVLLARGAGDWWHDISQRDSNVALLFGTGEEAMDTMRLADVAPGETRLNLWRASAAALKPHLLQAGYAEVAARDPAAPAVAALAARFTTLQQHADFARPLAIQMEALLWLRWASPGAGERGIAPMLERMVALERAHWEKVTEGVSNEALDRAVAQVTAVQGVEGREQAIALLQADNTHFGSRSRYEIAKVIGELLKLYGEELSVAAPAAARERLAPLEPDLIGEHHVATAADAELIDACLRWIETEPAETQQKRRRDLLTVLQRATQPEHGAVAAGRPRELLDNLIRMRLAPLASDVVAVMIETPGELLRILDRRLDELGEETLTALDAALPLQSLALMELLLHVAERRMGLARNLAADAHGTAEHDTALYRLAACVGTVAIRLSSLGRKEEALTASQEALDITRRLAESKPADFLPGLATSLNSLCRDFGQLGRYEDGLVAGQEAVDIYRRLAQTQPDIFRPALANSLSNLGETLSRLEHPGEALAASEEAVEIFRQLAEIRPDEHLPDLALSLDNLGVRLSSVGRREEALVIGREAVSMYRKLTETGLDAFLPDLARSLSNLGVRVARLGRHEEAITATQEAVDIRRQLAQTRPEAFLPDLATSLNNLGSTLSALGRYEEALTPSREAVDIRRQLAQTRPAAFLPDLARSLDNLGIRLSDLGRLDEALAATQEAVDITMRLMQNRLEANLPNLASHLSNLSSHLLRLGRSAEAIAASQKAVDVRRQLSQSLPNVFLPNLATSLGRLGEAMMQAGRDKEAAAAWSEGLATIAPFLEQHPDAFGDLARGLAGDYLGACEKADLEPDESMLYRIMRALGEDTKC